MVGDQNLHSMSKIDLFKHKQQKNDDLPGLSPGMPGLQAPYSSVCTFLLRTVPLTLSDHCVVGEIKSVVQYWFQFTGNVGNVIQSSMYKINVHMFSFMNLQLVAMSLGGISSIYMYD